MPTNTTPRQASTSASRNRSPAWSSSTSSSGLRWLISAWQRRVVAWTYRTCPPNLTPMEWYRQTVQFCVDAFVLVMTVLAMLPIGKLYSRAYLLSCTGTVANSFLPLYLLHGKPRAWNLPALQEWFEPVVVTKEFIYIAYGGFIVNSYVKFALIPIFVRALEHTTEFLRRYFSRSTLYRKYFKEACVWVESNTANLSVLSSQVEIGLGFLLIISLFTRWSNPMQVFMYWQLLKFMSNAPATAGNHRNRWAKIGRIIRYIPFSNWPISIVQRWWFG